LHVDSHDAEILLHEDNEFLGGKVHFQATLGILPMLVFGLHQCSESAPQIGIFSSRDALEWFNVAERNLISLVAIIFNINVKKVFFLQRLYSPSAPPEAVCLAWARRQKG